MNADKSNSSESVSHDAFSKSMEQSGSKKRRRRAFSSASVNVAHDHSAESFVSPSKLTVRGENSSVPSLQTQSLEGPFDTVACASRSNLFPSSDIEENESNPEAPNAVEGLPHNNSKKESSLFGNVMKNVSASFGIGVGTSSSNPTSFGPPPTTPARTQQPLFSASPGGFQLLDFVNGFGNSPLFQRFSKPSVAPVRTPDPTRRNAFSELSQTPEPQPQTDVPQPTPRQEVEWHECCVAEGEWMVDWSLKSVMEIQCHPKIPMIADEFQQSILQQFVSPSFTGRIETVQSLSSGSDNHSTAHLIEFHAALCYWQHPGVHPLPNDFFSLSGRPIHPTMLKSDSAMSKIKSSYSDSGNSNSSSRHAMPPPKKSMRAFSDTNSNAAPSNNRISNYSNGAFIQSRAEEWQASFRSLYRVWEQKIRDMNAEWTLNGRLDHDIVSAEMIKKVSETYFYALGKGHTILFRVGGVRNKDRNLDTAESEATFQFTPEIVISSSSQSFRTKLRSMGVELFLLNDWNGQTGVFEEEGLLGSHGHSNGMTQDVTASPNVLAELLALRRAQMCGWNVGADVAVSLKPKTAHRQGFNGFSPKSVPPLLISGNDQCASFSILYSLALGQIGMSNYDSPMEAKDLSFDVPLLICRKLGPFLNGSIKSITPYVKEQHAKKDPFNTQTTVQIEGLLLPCAVRDLVSATISFVLAPRVSGGKAKIIQMHSKTEENNEAHQFVVKVLVHTGDEWKTLNSVGMIGSHCSKRLNGSWSFLQTVDKRIETQNCHGDEVLNTIVWDVSHPESVAIKLDHLSLIAMK